MNASYNLCIIKLSTNIKNAIDSYITNYIAPFGTKYYYFNKMAQQFFLSVLNIHHI